MEPFPALAVLILVDHVVDGAESARDKLRRKCCCSCRIVAHDGGARASDCLLFKSDTGRFRSVTWGGQHLLSLYETILEGVTFAVLDLGRGFGGEVLEGQLAVVVLGEGKVDAFCVGRPFAGSNYLARCRPRDRA